MILGRHVAQKQLLVRRRLVKTIDRVHGRGKTIACKAPVVPETGTVVAHRQLTGKDVLKVVIEAIFVLPVRRELGPEDRVALLCLRLDREPLDPSALCVDGKIDIVPAPVARMDRVAGIPDAVEKVRGSHFGLALGDAGHLQRGVEIRCQQPPCLPVFQLPFGGRLGLLRRGDNGAGRAHADDEQTYDRRCEQRGADDPPGKQTFRFLFFHTVQSLLSIGAADKAHCVEKDVLFHKSPSSSRRCFSFLRLRCSELLTRAVLQPKSRAISPSGEASQ